MWEVGLLVFSLFIIGSLFVIHMKKAESIFCPWVGVLFLSNIAVLLNFAKIAINKNILDIRFFNGITFILITLIFTAFISILHATKKDFDHVKKRGIVYFIIAISIVTSTFIFFNKLGDNVIAKGADELNKTSLVEQMFRDQHLKQGQWEIGISVIVALISKVLGTSTIAVTKIIHGLFIVLLDVLLTHSIVKITKPREKNALLIALMAILISTFLILQIYTIPLKSVFVIGLVVLISNIMLDLLQMGKDTQKNEIYAEEIVFANTLVFLAAVDNWIFKLTIALLLMSLAISIVRRQNTSFLI